MFEVEVKGEGEFYAELERFARRLSDVRRWPGGWGPFAAIRYEAAREHFLSEGQSSGPPHTPLAARTLIEKFRLGYGSQPILMRRGDLFRSFAARGAPHNVHEERADEFVSGSSSPVGRFHQGGAGNLPVRHALRVGERERAEYGAQFFRSVRGLAEETRFDVA